jgi:hypothetical protein
MKGSDTNESRKNGLLSNWRKSKDDRESRMSSESSWMTSNYLESCTFKETVSYRRVIC